MRNLVSVQEIKALSPIEGADRIEVATILGWKLVVKKGEFKVGDKCAYFEVDSFLPIEDRYEFLRGSSFKRHKILGEGFRIRTQKLRGQISQGLALPLAKLNLNEDLPVDTDLTEVLHVRKWEPLEQISDFGILTDFPDGISKTDETRIQSIYDQMMEEFAGRPYYISTKIDGTSVTMYRKNGKFGVCCHENEVKEDDTTKSFLWDIARELDLENRMIAMHLDNIAIQGELTGPKIRKNRLQLLKHQWFVFTIKDLSTGHRLSLNQMLDIANDLGLTTVPIEETGENLQDKYPTLDSLLERAKGYYQSGQKKEGIVIRPKIPVASPTLCGALSFKVLNNDFLLKE